MKHALQNFQIPVFNFDRALSFYSTLMKYDLMVMELPEYKLGIFNFDQEGGVGGVIISGSEAKPSKDGTIVYLHCGEDLSENLVNVEKAGGKIHVSKSQLGSGMGYFAVIDDTEGNRVGLYSTN